MITYAFLMPAVNVAIDTYTAAKTFQVRVTENISEGGTFANIGYTTTNLLMPLGDRAVVLVTPSPGDTIKNISATDTDSFGNTADLSGAFNAEAGTYTFTMPAANVVVKATFVEVTDTATLQTIGQGRVFLNGYFTDNISADYLDTVTVSVTPAVGWKLVSLTVDGGEFTGNEDTQEIGGTYTLTMPERDFWWRWFWISTSMTAIQIGNFYEKGHSSVITDPADFAAVGERVCVMADPYDGYRLKSISVVDIDGNSIPVSFVSSTTEYAQNRSFTVLLTVQGSSYYTDVQSVDVQESLRQGFLSAITRRRMGLPMRRQN